MPSVAIIAEGITDQIFLESVLHDLTRRELNDSVDVNYFRPRADETELRQKADDHGGWENVLRSCHDVLRDALEFNDLVVIQIDADVCEEERLGISLCDENGRRHQCAIIHDMIARLIAEIDPALFAEKRNRIVFAIPMMSTECWVLRILFPSFSRNMTTNCEHNLGRAFAQKKIRYNKNGAFYDRNCRVRRFKSWADLSGCKSDLGIFVNAFASSFRSL